MKNQICKFSEGMITLPEGYSERTINTFVDKRSALPPITLSRDVLGHHNSIEEYIESQLVILKKQVKDWQQAAYKPIALGDNLAEGVLIKYDFLRPDNIRQYQTQAIFTLNMEHLLILTLSKPSMLTEKDQQCLADIVNGFKLYD